MKTFNAYIIEKLKVTKGSYKTGDELFEFVMYGLKHYPEDELDVKSLKIKINDFKTFKESVFSQIGESPEEILTNILDLLNK